MPALLALVVSAPSAWAQIPAEALARALSLVSDAAAAMAPPQARVVTLPGAPDPRWKLAPCSRVEAYLPSGVPLWGRTRVGLRCTDGTQAWNVRLPVTVQVWAPAWVLQASLPAGALLTASQLMRGEEDWGAALSPPVSDDAAPIGRSLLRPVQAGQAVHAADLVPRRWFGLGDTVRISASGNGFAISTEGQALSTGYEGQSVRVRTDSGRIVSGRAVGQQLVEVRL
jgi:flagella basal body P-ring formation protein FlgA